MLLDTIGRAEAREQAQRYGEAVAIQAIKRQIGHELKGYCLFAPSQEAAEIDRKVAADSICDNCGGHGMTYVGFSHWYDLTDDNGWDSYRAFAYCPVCGQFDEF